MHRRKFLSAAVGSLPILTHAASGDGSKKGWAGGSADFHKLFRASWYYNWTPNPGSSQSAEFVPMIKGAGNMKQLGAIRKRQGVTHLLGFNEPERAKQGNVKVDAAIKLWPQLEAVAKEKSLRLGSPACSGQIGMKWFREFMKKAEDKGLHMDFIAFHYYSLNASGFERTLENLADTYDLPIWVTEFNGWNGDESDNRKFLKDSLRFLERERYIERYAYFNFKPGRAQALVDTKGDLTQLGKMYREAGS
ncbi:MAG: glycoside hydrolase family protein [Verrucomicrobiales bacterium]|nr:glycoside hydrolase family protein [Verrucomicrobiales bacterium]